MLYLIKGKGSDMMTNKNLIITISLTITFFLFILFLLYVIYCYSYYDNYLKDSYVKEFNHHNYNFIYNHLDNHEQLSITEFNSVIDLMYNKNTLKDLYNLYYKDSSLYPDLDSFLNSFYYGDKLITTDDVIFTKKGQSTLFKRSEFTYNKINVSNQSGNTSALGVIDNVVFNIEENSQLTLDGNPLECLSDHCTISSMFMGLHEISYVSNGFTYFGLVNVTSNIRNINITILDSLVKINEQITSPIVPDASLNMGTYNLNECYVDSTFCAAKGISYLELREDKTCKLYEYISFTGARYLYEGTYKISGNFLILDFNGYLYQLYDTDTHEKSDINVTSSVEMIYKIVNQQKIISDKYSFILST